LAGLRDVLENRPYSVLKGGLRQSIFIYYPFILYHTIPIISCNAVENLLRLPDLGIKEITDNSDDEYK
jgi:hypothetical protein